MDERLLKIFKNMSPLEKLEASMNLYYSAREIKTAWVRKLHPNWTQNQIDEAVKEIFLNAAS